MDAGLGNEWCQQRRGELNGSPSRALHHSLDGTTVINQALMGRDVDVSQIAWRDNCPTSWGRLRPGVIRC